MARVAAALADRYQRDGQVSDLSEAVRLQELAEWELASDDPRRRQVLNNLANAVVALWRAERDQAALDRLTGLLERLVYLSMGLAVVLGFIGVKLVLEAMHTNEALFDILRDASVATGMPDGWCAAPCRGERDGLAARPMSRPLLTSRTS